MREKILNIDTERMAIGKKLPPIFILEVTMQLQFICMQFLKVFALIKLCFRYVQNKANNSELALEELFNKIK